MSLSHVQLVLPYGEHHDYPRQDTFLRNSKFMRRHNAYPMFSCSTVRRASMMALILATADGLMLLAQALILPPEHFAAYWRAKGMCAGSAFCLCGTRLLGYEGTRTFSWKISFMLLVNLTFTVLCARVNGTVK